MGDPAPSLASRRRRRRLALAVLAAVVLSGLGLWAFGQLRAWRHLRAADRALRQRDFDAAREHLAACLQTWPDSADAHLAAARAARCSGRLDEAEEHLAFVQDHRGSSEALTLEYAMLRAQRGDLAGTERYLRDHLREDDPESGDVLEALTAGYVQTFRLTEALAAAGELVRREPDHFQGRMWHGWALEQLHRFEEALEEYRRAVALRPDDVYAHLSAGEVLLFRRRPAEALEHFEFLRQRQPDNPAVLLGLARCLRGVGRTEDARRLLDDLLRGLPDEPLVLGERGQVALQEGDLARAERWLRRAAAGRPGDRQVNYALAQCLQAEGKADEAKQFLARTEEADAGLQRLTELVKETVQDPHAPAPRCEVGRLYLRLGRDEEGLRWLRSALQEDPRYAPAQQALAEYYQRHAPSAPAAAPGRPSGSTP